MFSAANGDRPKKPNYNTLVLATDGFNTPEVVPANIPGNVDRVIVIGIGPTIKDSIKDLATYPGDFIQASLTCQFEEFLRQRLLCEDKTLTVTPSTTCVRINAGAADESSGTPAPTTLAPTTLAPTTLAP